MIKALIFSMLLVSTVFGESVYKASLNGATTGLDPIHNSSIYDSFVVLNLFDTLYTYKYLARPYVLKPNLAESTPVVSKDGLTYTIKIKKGTKFIDSPAFTNGLGREVTAHDFVYSIKRNFDPKERGRNEWLWRDRIVGLEAWKAAGANYGQKIEGLQALDDQTIQIKLTKPYPQLLYTLAMAPSGIVPHEAVKKFGPEFGVKAVGSGPYKLQSFNSKRAIIVRNENYRKEKLNLMAEGYDEATHGFTGIKALDGKFLPITDKVEIHFMNQIEARWVSLNKGNEIQLGTVPPRQVDNVLSSKSPVVLKPKYAEKFHHLVNREFGLVFNNFNMDDPSFGTNPDPTKNAANRALRCAIRKAFNWKDRIDKFYYGLGDAYPGVIPPGLEGYNPALSKESVTVDIEGAKKLLKEHGWTPANLPTLENHSTQTVMSKQMYEQLRGFLGQIGYPHRKVRFKPYANFGDFSKALKQRKAMFFGMGWAIDYPDAENLLALYYGGNASPGSNSSNYVNPEYDKLFEQASTMLPSPKRTAIYEKLNEMVINDCVAISGFSRMGIYLWHKNVLMYPDRDVLGGAYVRYVGVK